MGRHKSVTGTCHLCGEYKPLTFEHVPPKSTYNNNGSYVEYPVEEYMKIKNPLKEKPRGKIKQGGIGRNSLCKECNNFLNHNYVEPYRKWVNGGIQVVSQGRGNLFTYVMLGIEPLKIFKQTLSMFLSINDKTFSQNNQELRDFIQIPKRTNLSEKYQLYTYLNNEGEIRYMGYTVHGNLLNGSIIPCCEITFPPYGYVLTIDQKGTVDGKLTNITRFKNYNIDQKVDFRMTMYQLPTYLQIPMDYRSKDVIDGVLGD